MAGVQASERLAVGRARNGISLVGLGNWGSSLAAAAFAAGIPLIEVVVREETKGRQRQLYGVTPVAAAEAKFDAKVLWICVPDGKIAEVAKLIAARRVSMRGQVVVHSSGALTVTVLEAVRRAGAKVAGIAPIFSFPTRTPVDFKGALFAVEAASQGGPGLWRRLSAIVRQLGGKPLQIASEKKLFYHAAATMASPLLVSALEAAVAMAGLAGLTRRESEGMVEALAVATLRNYFEKGSEGSFSGAFARGDAATVEVHLRGLLEHHVLHSVYLALARHAIDSLPVRNRLELERVLGLWSEGRVRN